MGSAAVPALLQIGPNEDEARLARCVAEIQKIPSPFTGFEAKTV